MSSGKIANLPGMNHIPLNEIILGRKQISIGLPIANNQNSNDGVNEGIAFIHHLRGKNELLRYFCL